MAGKKTLDQLNQLTDMLVSKITSSVDVDEIILFGSYSKGLENDLSDIDIAVISPELDVNAALFKNTLTITRRAQICEPYLQLLAFPSSIYYNEDGYSNSDFIREIKRTGKVLYRKVGL